MVKQITVRRIFNESGEYCSRTGKQPAMREPSRRLPNGEEREK